MQQTLIAIRKIGTHFLFTELYKQDGTFYASYNELSKQPRYGIKVLTINCWQWRIVWQDQTIKG